MKPRNAQELYYRRLNRSVGVLPFFFRAAEKRSFALVIRGGVPSILRGAKALLFFFRGALKIRDLYFLLALFYRAANPSC